MREMPGIEKAKNAVWGTGVGQHPAPHREKACTYGQGAGLPPGGRLRPCLYVLPRQGDLVCRFRTLVRAMPDRNGDFAIAGTGWDRGPIRVIRRGVPGVRGTVGV